jgi:hypothetical protein
MRASRWSSALANEFSRIRPRVRSGRVAAYSIATGPAATPANSTTSSSPAAVTTACKSSDQPSNVGSSADDTGSDSPVPRWSYDITVANDISRSINRSPGPTKSWFVIHDGTETMSCSPPANTLNASLASPLIA